MRFIKHKFQTEPGCWWYSFAFGFLLVVALVSFSWGYIFLR
jgi:hypothetical protein